MILTLWILVKLRLPQQVVSQAKSKAIVLTIMPTIAWNCLRCSR
jgi:hypothetical protein